MLRHCDGTDPGLYGEQGGPCSCGLEFDDIEQSPVYPHILIPPRDVSSLRGAAPDEVLIDAFVLCPDRLPAPPDQPPAKPDQPPAPPDPGWLRDSPRLFLESLETLRGPS